MGNAVTTEQRIRVVVLGGGYAGVMAGNRFLASLTDAERGRIELRLVNPRDVFVERIRLHQLVAGSRDSVTIGLSRVLHPDAKPVIGRAERIDHHRRTVRVRRLEEDLDLPFDYLVLAVGSRAAAPIPGSRANAFLLADHDGAEGAATAVSTCRPGAEIAVVGGGLTAVETVGELAEQRPDVSLTLYCASELLPAMRTSARESIRKTLCRKGVRIVENAPVAAIGVGAVHLDSGTSHGYDVCLVARSFDVPALAATSGLPTDRRGRLQVDETLRCITDPRVIGAGDAVVAPAAVAGHLRMGCATALPLGAHAAATLLASIRGTRPPTLSVGYLVQCVGLGRRAYVQLVRADDTPRHLHVGGRAGATIKHMISSMVVAAPVKEIGRPGAYRWPKGPSSSPAISRGAER